MESEKTDQAVLIGSWYASYTNRVEVALKIKGIPYEYIEEDTTNKSELLLRHNPVHKQVPVLVHNGRLVAESLVILKYIDEQWSRGPRLLPEDPYHRAKVRFWANFYNEKIKAGGYSIIKSRGKDRDKAIDDYMELLKVFVEGIQRDFPSKSLFHEGESLGHLGIVVGANAGNYEAFNEAFGLEVGPHNSPAFFSWVDALKDHPVMKETLPPPHKLVAKLKKSLPVS
ncbi:glutathione S-transferase U10-like [Punica granatum]|uniref:Glutathione S-transferase n=1 Tax=Punica granatum TaxID=22663 RepID=A0A218XWW7_PUNGR|nr:glutathione S-transferase U10-like [Punica granatum]OWM89547.1 hypothetical protein CDL15_Pgr024295 [Punica granatum]